MSKRITPHSGTSTAHSRYGASMQERNRSYPARAAEAPYAGFWKRFAALLIDLILIGVISYLLWFITPSLALAGILIGWLYSTVMESSRFLGTLGKKLLRLQVVDLDGERLSLPRSAARSTAKLLSALNLCAGYLVAVFTPRKQAVHDLLASTLVLDGWSERLHNL